MSLPDVEKISKLIDALKDYSTGSARRYWEEHGMETYYAPSLAAWDVLSWFELVQDWELVSFLTGGSEEAKLLMRSLQKCLQWYGQSEVDDILRHLNIMSTIN